MNDVKKKLMQEIERKIARKKEMAARAIERNSIDAFVTAFIADVEDINAVNLGADGSSEETWGALYPAAEGSLINKLRSFDPHCHIEISWNRENEKAPQVNGVLIKWSPAYQTKHGVEPELFVDIMTSLFKD